MSDKGNSPSPQEPRDDAAHRSRSQSPRDNSPRGGEGRSRSKSPKRVDPDDVTPELANPGNNVYVANLAHRIGQPELEEIFAKYGRLEKTEVIIDPISRESRGFAFVTFEDLRDAEDAVNELNGKEFYGRRIRVEHAKRKRGHDKTPGKYLGPKLASTKYGRDQRRGRSRSRDRDRRRSRSRSRSRDRGSRRYDDRDRYDRGRYDDRGDRERGRNYDRERGGGGGGGGGGDYYDGRRSSRR